MPRVLTHRQRRTAPPVTDATRLQLMWLASPALPVGGFSYSEGLEAAIDQGLVSNEASASAWLRDQLLLSLARADLAVLARAVRAWQRHDLARITELNDWVLHTRETSELRLQAEQMGRSLVEWLRNRRMDGTPPQPLGSPANASVTTASATTTDPRLNACAALPPAPTWPVAFGLAVAQCLPDGIPAQAATIREALVSFTFGWAENMAQAAIKAVPLGQSAGQRILQSLIDTIPAAIDHAMALGDSERQAFTPMLAILSSQHETQYSRLFRS